MQDETTNWAEVRDWTVTLVAEAAAQAKTMVREGFAANIKANGTVVTEVDRATERFLRAEIGKRFPDHAILGEEYGQSGTLSPEIPLWCLDPVDGTTNLANGLPLWCVSVGVILGDRSMVGVLNAPMMQEVYAAAIGQGATRNGEPLSPLGAGGPLEKEDAYVICSTTAKRMNFSRLPAKLRVLGSAALDMCFVAAKQVRGCHCVGTSLYDVAAALCVTEEVGASSVWLESGEVYSPAAHLSEGPRGDRTLVTAPPETIRFLRDVLGNL